MNSEPHRAKIDSAEILAIGTELLLGETVDTNGASIAARLAEHGVDVYWSMRVGDNRDRIVAALEAGLARSDLVITSGGLGPTDDDLTRESIAHVAGQVPEVDTELERDLRAYFARSGRTMPERNVKQAWLIPSATALPNPHGTAPGWLVRLNRSGRTCMIAALPGPPREMLPMLEEQLLPRLALPDAHLWSRTFKTGGIGESHVAELLGDLTQASNPSVATYARADGVHVRVAAKAGTKTDAEALGAPVAARVADLLGAAVWGRDDEHLETTVIDALRRTGATLTVREAATEGALASRLAAADPERKVFVGGVVGFRVDAGSDLASSRGEYDSSREDAFTQVDSLFATDAAIAVGELRLVDDERGHVECDVTIRDAAGTERTTVRLPARSGPWLRDRIVLQALDLLRRRLRDPR